MDSAIRWVGLLFLATTACAEPETQPVIETPSLDTPPPEGQIVATVSPPPPVLPFALPKGFDAQVDQAPLVATLGDRVVVIRRLTHCEKVWGPSTTISLPKLGTGTITQPPAYRDCSSWVDALDPDGAALWRTPVALRGRNVTLLGDRFLTASEGHLALYDVATGALLGSVDDRVIGRQACVDSSHERVFTNDWDDRTRDAVVDLPSMTLRPAGRARCDARPFTDCRDGTSRACFESRDERRAPTTAVSGFYEAATLRTSSDEVLIGRQTQGRKLPMVVAVDPVKHLKRWAALVPPPDAQPQAAEDALFPHRYVDIAGGKLFIEYDAWLSHPHLAAFDLKDGARIWDVPIHELNAFTPTAERIYMTDRLGLRVLDAATGKEMTI
jgi:hypothetical protein